MKEEFLKTFELIRKEFKEVFRALFHGGEADLKLTSDDILIVGDRHSVIEYAVNSKVKMIILSGFSEIKDKHIELAKENVRLHERSFSEGLATVDDLNDARNKLIATQVARSVAAYRFVVAYSLLHAASGQMVSFADAFNNPKTVFVTP